MSERILLAIAASLLILLVGLGFFWSPELPERILPKAPIAAGGDFTLQSATGAIRRPVSRNMPSFLIPLLSG